MSEKEIKTADESPPSLEAGIVKHDPDSLTALGYTPELRRNRSLFTLLFQSLAIAAIPFGEGSPLISGK
jgi:hypothetical protein